MAEKSTTWTDLLAGLIRGFVLLRDVFGYILPGFVFLLIGVRSGRVPEFNEFCKICGVDLPRWMAGILVLITSYVLGHFVVATVFFPLDLVRLISEKIGKKEDGDEKKSKEGLDAQSQEVSLLHYIMEGKAVIARTYLTTAGQKLSLFPTRRLSSTLRRRSIMEYMQAGFTGLLARSEGF